MDLREIIYNLAQSIPGFLMAIVVHEVAHGWVAEKFGDSTARLQGRLSLNPVVHYDPWGTVFFPLLGAFMGWAIIGWAKPVPVDSRNFKNFKKGLFWVSFAGPLSNIILGVVSAFLFAIVFHYIPKESMFYNNLLLILRYSIFINFILATFNLLPLPPLDGSKMVAAFLPPQAMRKYEEIGRFTPMIILGIFALSTMGIHVLGRLFLPVQVVANEILMFFLSVLA
ncbi:MAG: site-2 protease family protein [Bacteriovoracaceae bacterium]|nr:site-2 protease family protein [Bacteriovoracaceae bacterium]